MVYYSRYITGMKKVVCGVSLLPLALTWPKCAYRNVKPSWTQAIPCSSLVRSLWLKMTGVSITLTKCTPWCLCYHQSLSLWFRKWLRTLPSSFLPSSGLNDDSTLKFVSVCMSHSIVGTFSTYELRKWSRLPSCHWDQEVIEWQFLAFLGSLFLRNLGMRFI
jgi:hypothetical protein